ncbi:MAG: flagellin [Phycisphaerae bacterium]
MNRKQESLSPLQRAREQLQTHGKRLASGKRIHSAADDAAGLAIAQLIRADVASLNQRVRNANDGASALQVADGALGEVNHSLARMKELATQAAGGVLSEGQKQIIADEFNSLAEGIDATIGTTRFNGQALLDGEAPGPALDAEAGAFRVDPRMDATAVKGLSFDDPVSAMHAVDEAIEQVSGYRATVGTMINRLETAASTQQIEAENQLAAQSRIEDADFAVETAALASASVRSQASVAMQAHSNGMASRMMSLLMG